MGDLRYISGEKTVLDLINLYQDGRLNLEPGFQRQSVWTDRDRRHLIDSIIRGYPLPSIFLYKRHEQGYLIYDVIDGKQRIETLLMYAGEIRGARFDSWVHLPGTDGPDWIDWSILKRRHQQHLITGYRVQCIEVEGELSDIIDVFVRINSTGKALTRAERRHARYYHNSEFLRKAGQLAERYAAYLQATGVVSAQQRSRMKHVELLCELMLSAHTKDVINKKAVLDKVMESNSMTPRAVARAADATVRCMNRMSRMFPRLSTTRFSQISDFYSLAVLIMQFDAEGKILTDRRRNRLASELLAVFSDGVDEVRLKQRQVKAIKNNEEVFRDYLITVKEGTDAESNRQRRSEILRGLLESLFEKKDANRVFSKEQRRILWNTTNTRRCAGCNCLLTWDAFTIDHIRPHSKGGRTQLENAALMCVRCNSSKGNRRAC
jgi:hypothetical protein